MGMFTAYFEVSVNFNVENRSEKFIIRISILYPIYRILIKNQNLLCFPPELLMRFLDTFTVAVGEIVEHTNLTENLLTVEWQDSAKIEPCCDVHFLGL